MTERRRATWASAAAVGASLVLACVSGGPATSRSGTAARTSPPSGPILIAAAGVDPGVPGASATEGETSAPVGQAAQRPAAESDEPFALAGEFPSWNPRATAEARLRGFAQELLFLVNRDRRAARVGALPIDPEAAGFARSEAQRLVDEGRFGHRAADGSDPSQRWKRGGGTGPVAENLYRLTAREGRAYALFDPAEAHDRLMSSRKHRRNVLDPTHRGAGIALAFDPLRNSVYVVEEFVGVAP